MNRSRPTDVLPRLSRAERRAWKAVERKAQRDHETDQLVALLGLAAAGGGVTGVTTPAEEHTDQAAGTAVEMIIDGRRLRAGRVHRRSLSNLRDAVTSIAAVPLTAVGRYGPYWVLTFRVATEQLVLLVDHLTLLPEWGGGGRDVLPGVAGPLVGAGA